MGQNTNNGATLQGLTIVRKWKKGKQKTKNFPKTIKID